MSNLPWGTSKFLTDEEFFNRTQEINNLTNLLNSTGENNAPDILVTGIRGVGKTVLLNKIKQFMDKNYLVVYMDFSLSQTYQKNKMSYITESSSVELYSTMNDLTENESFPSS